MISIKPFAWIEKRRHYFKRGVPYGKWANTESGRFRTHTGHSPGSNTPKPTSNRGVATAAWATRRKPTRPAAAIKSIRRLKKQLIERGMKKMKRMTKTKEARMTKHELQNSSI